MKTSLLFAALLTLASVASAADSPKDVQALIARGDFPGAEKLLRQAVSEHPASAKAHYVLAEVLAHEGNIGEAKAEATMAATLDPGTHFTDPAKFQAFQRELGKALAPVSSTQRAAVAADPGAPEATGSRGASHLVGLAFVGGIALLLVFFLIRRRRDAVPATTGYSYAPPIENPPPYGAYPGNGAYAPPPAPHSGVGTAVAAGLGGVAAGMLLDEALRSHGQGSDVPAVNPVAQTPVDSTGQAYDDLRDRPVDMGNDDDSWDDGASGDGGSSDDDNW
ncbi:Tetratricopeptide repeat-containing protein [Luteibacter sp. UNCMF331Sha3.1]|uniref:tetratricopeptide repeat protein n=1 Tax=Luteibacter sp. UNCMF331Sha3.1 TaxID=1502760 RepID=UPI0008C82CDC|nr:tetratricopeptide repeat protein [Luteibacter sp. UNCMF331Sha3.1]SEN20676.1 Tetratricopeptide repeat-containing protein [Luteibacter sp. UNCMF331Sha3.1]